MPGAPDDNDHPEDLFLLDVVGSNHEDLQLLPDLPDVPSGSAALMENAASLLGKHARSESPDAVVSLESEDEEEDDEGDASMSSSISSSSAGGGGAGFTTKRAKMVPAEHITHWMSTTTYKKPQKKYDPPALTGMSKQEISDWRRQQRKQRNRASAAASRQRQKDRIVELEQELHEWHDKVTAVYAQMATLTGQAVKMPLPSPCRSATPPPVVSRVKMEDPHVVSPATISKTEVKAVDSSLFSLKIVANRKAMTDKNKNTNKMTTRSKAGKKQDDTTTLPDAVVSGAAGTSATESVVAAALDPIDASLFKSPIITINASSSLVAATVSAAAVDYLEDPTLAMPVTPVTLHDDDELDTFLLDAVDWL